jgi:ketosteroid isomerase-like protein
MRSVTRAATVVLMLGLAAADAAVQEEVMQAEKAWAAAVVRGDHSTLDRLLADGLIYTHSSGLVEDKSAYLGRLKSGALKYESLDPESITVKPYQNAAILHYKTRMKGVSDGQPFSAYAVLIHVWVKQGGAWKLAAHHATRLP